MKESLDQEVLNPNPYIDSPAVELQLPTAELPEAFEVKRAWWERISFTKIGLFVLSLYFFFLAITLMKQGARGLAPLLQNSLSLSNAMNSLGFGWLFAYVIMSGSPVAAAALTFFDAGILSKFDTYAMITGSRLGASFIVILIGFLYVLRGRDKATSLSIGLLSLLVTVTTYLPALFLGAVILQSGVLDTWQVHSIGMFDSVTDLAINPIVSLLSGVFPKWSLFLIGMGVILVSFNLFDKCLPQMTIKESHVGNVSQLVYRSGVMFALGAAITLITMSVSLSISVLVPLSARGLIRRENVIPYIMGANITTFVDTLLAALLLKNPLAFTVVFVEMLSIAIVSAFILATSFKPYQSKVLASVAWATNSNKHLTFFMACIFVVPIILLLIK